MTEKGFNVTVRENTEAAVICAQGYLNDIMGEELHAAFSRCVDDGHEKIIINMDKVEFINSIGISIILGIMDIMVKTGGKLCFSNLSPLHYDTFSMLGLGGYIVSFGSEQEAMEYLKGNGNKG